MSGSSRYLIRSTRPQRPAHARPADTLPGRNLGRRHAFHLERADLGGLPTSHWLSPPVAAVTLPLGNNLTLVHQHHLPRGRHHSPMPTSIILPIAVPVSSS